jgi:hypothetical protein
VNAWYSSLPPAAVQVPCGEGQHTVRWESGALVLADHPDAEAELVLAALGGDKPHCVELAEMWDSRARDIELLTVLPRSSDDEIRVRWEDIDALRSARRGSIALSGPAGAPLPAAAMLPANAPPRIHQMRAEAQAARQRHLETLSVLALGPEFQMRLAGTVAAHAGDASPGGSKTPGDASPALAAALTGRFAPVAARWLGIDPGDVRVSVHTGAGWGRLYAADDCVWAALPVSWLPDVWACGLELADGDLVVGVTEPGWPEARVLALREPGGEPVEKTAHT